MRTVLPSLDDLDEFLSLDDVVRPAPYEPKLSKGLTKDIPRPRAKPKTETESTKLTSPLLAVEELDTYKPKLEDLLEEDTKAYVKVYKDDRLVDMFDGLELPKGFVPDVPEPKRLLPEQRIFLSHFLTSGTVTTALHTSKISLAKYKVWMTQKVFAQALIDATDAIADRLECEGLKQALSGNTKMLIKMLESLRPAKFGKSSTVNSFIEGKLQVEIKDWASLAQKAETIDITPELPEGGG